MNRMSHRMAMPKLVAPPPPHIHARQPIRFTANVALFTGKPEERQASSRQTAHTGRKNDRRHLPNGARLAGRERRARCRSANCLALLPTYSASDTFPSHSLCPFGGWTSRPATSLTGPTAVCFNTSLKWS